MSHPQNARFGTAPLVSISSQIKLDPPKELAPKRMADCINGRASLYPIFSTAESRPAPMHSNSPTEKRLALPTIVPRNAVASSLWLRSR